MDDKIALSKFPRSGLAEMPELRWQTTSLERTEPYGSPYFRCWEACHLEDHASDYTLEQDQTLSTRDKGTLPTGGARHPRPRHSRIAHNPLSEMSRFLKPIKQQFSRLRSRSRNRFDITEGESFTKAELGLGSITDQVVISSPRARSFGQEDGLVGPQRRT